MAKRFLTYDTQNPPSNVNEQGVMVGSNNGLAPLVLYADMSDEYDVNPTYGDKALKAIQEGRQILVRVPNASGDNYVASYSPVLMYQLPNHENNYLYLFYFRDEKQDLSSLVGQPDGTIQMPQHGQLKMKLSETYNGSPLGQPYINNSPAVGSSAGTKPVFFISNDVDGYGEVLTYYDNPDRFATVEEVVDAYMAGTAFFFDRIENCPSRITGFGISYGHTSGEVVPKFMYDGTSWNNRFKVFGSTVADLQAAMAKYLP